MDADRHRRPALNDVAGRRALPTQAEVQVERDGDEAEDGNLAADIDEAGQIGGAALQLKIDASHGVHAAAGHADVEGEVAAELNRALDHFNAVGVKHDMH